MLRFEVRLVSGVPNQSPAIWLCCQYEQRSSPLQGEPDYCQIGPGSPADLYYALTWGACTSNPHEESTPLDCESPAVSESSSLLPPRTLRFNGTNQ
jgi:hypothetical protein